MSRGKAGRGPGGGRSRKRRVREVSRPSPRSNLTVWLGVAAIVLGLGSLVLRLARGEGVGLAALLPIIAGLIAVSVSGRLGRS